ncbi:MAG TPA: hypothetical protein VLE53_11305 [Gemmatimonadaceae bacterium]|nr:hypothetical protein [Gemmatimonadaceae bacterium]
MPVTARLSKLFYDRLGEEIANELVEWFNAVDATYRADLRELHELNFARFDAKVEQRLAALDAKLERRLVRMDSKIDRLRSELGSQVDQLRRELGSQVDQLRHDMGSQGDRLRIDLEMRIDRLEGGLRGMEATFDAKLAAQDERLKATMEERFARQTRWLFANMMVAWLGVFATLIGLWMR